MSLEDAEPAPSTYYLFRSKLVDYAREHGEHLFEKCQMQITSSQALEFNVRGMRVRMELKSFILRYVDIHGHAARKEIDELLLEKLPDYLDEEQRKKRIDNIIQNRETILF